MRIYDPASPLIFIHVPKTAGSSVQEMFAQWYGPRLYRHYFNAAKQQLPPQLDLSALARTGTAPLIFGHFNRNRGFGIEQYYPEVQQFLTILRDPLDMHISRYFFTRKKSAANVPIYNDLGDADLQQHVLNGHLNMLEHFPRPVTFDNYKDIIEEFFIDIGLFEHLPQTLLRFSQKLHLDPTLANTLTHKNTTSRPQAFPFDLRAQFQEKWALEHEVYSYVCALQTTL